jgi:hypothetical protein
MTGRCPQLILGDCIKIKVTGVVTTLSLYAKMLKNACPQCIDFDYNYVLIYSS